jgi:hypothetical protein
MLRQCVCIATFFAASIVAAAAAPVRHAGEWQTIIDNGHPMISCFQHDVTMDQDNIMRTTARIPGASCKIANFGVMGNVISYSMQCVINGSDMTSSGSVTQTGPDAFTSKVHSHGGVIKIPNGKPIVIPDTDMSIASRRLGACKPGDRVNPY